MIVFPIFNTWAEPGGSYILTGKEKSIGEIIQADMKKYPDLYQGESLSSYTSTFKKENRIGKRKLSPGDELTFPDTLASIKTRTSSTGPKDHSNEASPELIIEETGSITTMAAWLAYGGARSLWRTEKFAEKYPEEQEYNYTFAEELDAKSAMVSFWKELGSTSSDPYLDDLVKIEGKGFLEEYIWETDLTTGWEEPNGLKLDHYKKWARKNIPNHKPESKVTIK